MNVRGVGAFIRSQRTESRLSLKKMSGLAGVSIPYLSQIERGLRRPSADILQAIAKGLRISAETLYVQAGILEERPVPGVAAAVMADPGITERQKQALLQIYEAFHVETGRSRETAGAKASAKSRAKRPAAAASSRSATRTTDRTTKRIRKEV